MTETADILDRTFVWLQHGVTMNAVGAAFNRINKPADMIVVATPHELSYGTRDGSLHTQDSVRLTGFPRFDLLNDTSNSTARREILFAPTWRSWLTGKILPDGSHAPIDGFLESDYFVHHRRFLTDPDVCETLRRSNAGITVLLHPGMSAYSSEYEKLSSDVIRVVAPGTVKYRDVLNSSSAMITDYSSVFFDFVYMRKPVIFDHFDEEQFRAQHYGSGVFDYESSAPGPIASDFEELKEFTIDLVQKDFVVSPAAAAQIDSIFAYGDKGNSARVLEAAFDVDDHRRAAVEVSRHPQIKREQEHAAE